MNATDKESSTGNEGWGGRKPYPKKQRRMVLARSYRDEAEYLLSVDPVRYANMAQKRIQEAKRLENQVYQILKGEDEK